MKKKNNKTARFEANVKNAINEIHTLLQEEPMNMGFARYRQNHAFVSSGCVLLNMGAVKNLGSITKPSYVWNDEFEVNGKLVSSVIDSIRSRFVQSKKASAPALEGVVSKPKAVPAVAILTTFTDQQLWDELKSRHYSIQDNQLYKITYLQ